VTIAATVNGRSLSRLELVIPQRGPWSATVEYDAADGVELSGSVTLAVGEATFVGTVVPGSSALVGRTGSARIVAGAGALGTVCRVQAYRGATVRMMLGDAVGEAGEALADLSAIAELDHVHQRWTRAGVPLRRALGELAGSIGCAWRTLDDGTIWVGTETWTETRVPHQLVSRVPGAGVVVVAPSDASLRPGMVWSGHRITTVVYELSARSQRARLWVTPDAPSGLSETLQRAVLAALPSLLYLQLHPARVVAQDGDDSLQVVPDSSLVPPMAGVPLRAGYPGLHLRVLPGARVLVSFEDGDPARPIAIPAWDTADGVVESVTLKAPIVHLDSPDVRLTDAYGSAVARVGDIVSVSMAFLVPDPTNGISLVSPVGPVTGTFGTALIPAVAVGQIVSGQAKARA
jgi:hypothetical protein